MSRKSFKKLLLCSAACRRHGSLMPGRQREPDKIPLIVVADRAPGRGLLSLQYMAAVEADPAGFHIVYKQLPFPQLGGKLTEPVGMDLFHLCDLPEVPGCRFISLLLRLLRKGGVYIVPLLSLMGTGQFQKFRYVLGEIHRIAGSGDYAAVASSLLQVAVKHLGMSPFLIGGIQEYSLNEMQPLFPCGCGKGFTILCRNRFFVFPRLLII